MSSDDSAAPNISTGSLGLAWLGGLLLCVYGLLDGVAEWSFSFSLAAFLWLAIVPIWWGWPSRRRVFPSENAPPAPLARKLMTATMLAGVSLSVSVWTARLIGDWPPAYHDEYSYLYQAKTFLAGRTWFPSHPTHPELFDQMHVLNDEGRMASRYFPGTGLWMAPFVAVGLPYFGHWLCGMLATVFIYAAGCELRNQRTGIIAGLLTGLSPGLALFGNLLLAHHPTLLGLSFFLWMMIRFHRRPSWIVAGGAALGLTGAMLCRPMTAAGFGLSFGIWTGWWLLRSTAPAAMRWTVFAAFAFPIGCGMAMQLGYNTSITGSFATSPYQLYTDIYTPRHVYGFNNGTRGEQRGGPKVIAAYDQWAENLTPELAAQNVFVRIICSCQWIWDLLPLGMIALIAALNFRRMESPLQLTMAGIISLHAVHIPYWYAGIMGWHYVFETLILWTLLSGGIIDRLLSQWRNMARPFRAVWLSGLIALTMAANLVTLPGIWTSKLQRGAATIRFSREKHGLFQRWVAQETAGRPALVLVGPHRDEGHVEYVNNDPGLTGRLLVGRSIPGQTDLDQIARDFPNRDVYVCDPDRHQLRIIKPAE